MVNVASERRVEGRDRKGSATKRAAPMFSLYLLGQDEGVVLIDTVGEEWSRERGRSNTERGGGGSLLRLGGRWLAVQTLASCAM